MSGQDLKSNNQYSLVNETYALEEAQELLMALLDGISGFHSLNTLRSWERSGAKDESSDKRVEELSKTRENILKLLREIDEEKLSIEVYAEIKVADKKHKHNPA